MPAGSTTGVIRPSERIRFDREAVRRIPARTPPLPDNRLIGGALRAAEISRQGSPVDGGLCDFFRSSDRNPDMGLPATARMSPPRSRMGSGQAVQTHLCQTPRKPWRASCLKKLPVLPTASWVSRCGRAGDDMTVSHRPASIAPPRPAVLEWPSVQRMNRLRPRSGGPPSGAPPWR